jgi:hypothetical protein
MRISRRAATLLYATIGLIALVGMWLQVAQFIAAHGLDAPLFLQQIRANPAVTMLTVEMACMALASSLYMYVETEHNGWRWWLLAAAIIGFGVIFPLFLAQRQRSAR